MSQLEPLPPFRTVRVLLRKVMDLHLKRLHRYAAAAETCPDHRRAALLEHLQTGEADLVAALGRCEDAGDAVLATFVQGVPAAALERIGAAGGALPQDPVRLLAEHRRWHEALIQLYRQLGAALPVPRVQALFRDLEHQVRANQRRLRQAVLDF